MLIYIIAFLTSSVFVFFAIRTKNKLLKIALMMIATLPFILLSAFRAWTIGIDTWKNYWPTYESVAVYGYKFDVTKYLLDKYSVGFCIIVYILSRICIHPAILFAACATIITGCTYSTIIKYSKNPVLSVFIFFFSGAFLLTLNGMRSYTALAIVFYAFRFIKTKEPIKYAIFVAIASLIHSSMVLFILLYPLYLFPIRRQHIAFIVIASIIFIPFARPILSILLAATPFSNYFRGEIFVDPLISMLIINSLILIVYISIYRKNHLDQDYNFFLKLQTISVVVCILSFCLPQSYRIEQLIDYWQIISIPYLLHCLKVKIQRKYYILALTSTMLVFMAYFTKSFVLSDTNQVRDYTSIFNHGK